MIRKIIQYIYPQRRMYSVPKQISARYDRVQMTPEEELILMAGMARDPAAARQTFAELEQQHGGQVWEHVQLRLRKQRTLTARQRVWMLARQILGEGEPRKFERRRKREPVVYSNFSHKDRENGTFNDQSSHTRGISHEKGTRRSVGETERNPLTESV